MKSDQKSAAREAELTAVLNEPRYLEAARELMQLKYDKLHRANKFRRTTDTGQAELVKQFLAEPAEMAAAGTA
jgi:hypothetical protein